MSGRGLTVLVSASLMLTTARAFTTANSPPSASTAVLSVTSEPAGAAVHVDGRFAGRTPLALTMVAAGDRRVRLTRDGYRDNRRVVKIRGRSHAPRARAVDNAIVYTADPSADVNLLNGLVNGASFVGTPMTLTRQ